MQNQTNSSETKSHRNGHLKASVAESSGLSREEMMNKFNREAKHLKKTASTKVDQALEWIYDNPKKSMLAGAAVFFLIGPKKIGKLAKVGISTGIFSTLFSSNKKN